MNNNDFIKKQARAMAEYEMENMTPAEIKEIEEKQKKFFIFVGCGALLFTVLMIVAMGLAWFSPSGEFLNGLFLLFGGIFFGYGVYFCFSKVQKGKERELVLEYLEGKYFNHHDLIDEEIVSKMFKDPNRIREIEVSAGIGNQTKIIVDNKEKNIQFVIQKIKTRKFDFGEILKYEVNENGDSVVKGTAGKALVGGLFFGIGGAFLGSQTSRKIKSKCSDLRVFIYLNDIDFPSIEIPIITSETSKNTEYYTSRVSLAKEICALLEFAINQKDLATYKESEEENEEVEKTLEDKKSDKQKLKELKEMLEEGLISEKDFEKKKKQILGL